MRTLAVLLLLLTAWARGQSELWLSPLHVSTPEKFDALMNALPTDCTVHLAGGTYWTSGGKGFWLKTGQKIIGSGMDVTVISLTNNAIGSHLVLGTDPLDCVDDVKIFGLTIDANSQNGSTNAQTLGAWIYGTHSSIQQVKVINLGTVAEWETWGLGIGTLVSPEPIEGSIERCVVGPLVRGNNLSAISAFAVGSYASVSYSGNWVICTNSAHTQGFNLCNTANSLLADNIVFGAGQDSGVYSDSGGNTNLVMRGNRFINMSEGTFLIGIDCVHQNLNIYSNVFELANKAPSWAVGICLGRSAYGGTGYSVGARITDNVFKVYSTASPKMQAVDARSAANVVAYDNVSNRVMQWYASTNNVYFYNNRNE